MDVAGRSRYTDTTLHCRVVAGAPMGERGETQDNQGASERPVKVRGIELKVSPRAHVRG